MLLLVIGKYYVKILFIVKSKKLINYLLVKKIIYRIK